MDRIFYKTDCTDSYTGLPIYVFDTSFLPSPDLINYDEFIPTLMKVLPQSNYILIMFSCGLNKISWVWGIKFLRTFLSADSDVNNLDNLVKIISVHDSWFVKSITQILTNYNLTMKNLSINNILDNFNNRSSFPINSFDNKVINCSTLSELTNYVDLTKLKLSLNIYKHDLLLEPSIKFSSPVTDLLNADTKINKDTNPVFFHHFYQIFNIVNLFGYKVESIFHKPGNKANTDILYHCIRRNQLIWINDWDLYCISTVFKRLLMDLPHPLIDCRDISLPIKDDFEHTLTYFNQITSKYNHSEMNYGMVLYQLVDMCVSFVHHNSTTKHSSMSIAKCLSYCISQELILLQNKDNVVIVTRIFKNLIDHWHRIKPLYSNKFHTVDQIIKGEELENNKIDNSYDLSHDITMEEENSDEDTVPVKINTSNLLNNVNLDKVSPSSSVAQDFPPTPISIKSHQYSKSLNSPVKFQLAKSSTSFSPSHGKKLSDVSNIQFQFPPQKYKFDKPTKKSSVASFESYSPPPTKKPVIRGRKVGELAKLFEERGQGFELLKGI